MENLDSNGENRHPSEGFNERSMCSGEIFEQSQDEMDQSWLEYDSISGQKPDKDLKLGYECKYCPAVFSRESDFTQHQNTHYTPLKCRYCKATFSKLSTLTFHEEAHDSKNTHSLVETTEEVEDDQHAGKPLHKCQICSRLFDRRSSLVNHYRKHDGLPRKNKGPKLDQNRTHTCHICSGVFTRATSLVNHLKTHKGDGKYKCRECSATYAGRHNLQIHYNYTHGIKSFQCHMCKIQFRKMNFLKAHWKRVGESPLRCCICLASFTDGNILTTHMLTCKSSEYEESVANQIKLTDTQGTRTRVKPPKFVDMEIVPYDTAAAVAAAEVRFHECYFCPSIFSSKDEVIIHEFVHTQNVTIEKESHGHGDSDFQDTFQNITFEKESLEFGDDVIPDVIQNDTIEEESLGYGDSVLPDAAQNVTIEKESLSHGDCVVPDTFQNVTIEKESLGHRNSVIPDVVQNVTIEKS